MVSRRQFCLSMLAAGAFVCTPTVALADTPAIQLMDASLQRVTDGPIPGLELSLNWEFDLTPALVGNLRRGIALYFVYDFRLEKSRWYWTDKSIVEAELLVRLSYSPLSHQYRLSRGGLIQTFDSLDLALTQIKHVRAWNVADANCIDNVDDYQAEARMRLDLSRLPKPLQVTIGGNSDWILESDWGKIPLNKTLNSR